MTEYKRKAVMNPTLQDNIDCVIQLAKDELEHLKRDGKHDDDCAADYQDSKAALERVQERLSQTLGEYSSKGGVYLIFVFGGVEPEILGPFENEDKRDENAVELRLKHGDEHGIFMLDIDISGTPCIHTYSGAFFEEVNDEGCNC